MMKTYILTLDETQEEVIKALDRALNIDMQSISEADEDRSLWLAIEDGKRYGRMGEKEGQSFLDDLGE